MSLLRSNCGVGEGVFETVFATFWDCFWDVLRGVVVALRGVFGVLFYGLLYYVRSLAGERFINNLSSMCGAMDIFYYFCNREIV